MVIVSQITANTLTTFPVNEDGTLGDAIENEPSGNGPFGFTFDGAGRLLVAQNSQAANERGTAAAYDIGEDGRLTVIGEAVPLGETDPCWFVITPDGQYGYITNFGPSGLLDVSADELRRGTISSVRIGEDGALELLDAQAAQLGVGAADMAIGGDGRYLYALNSVAGSVSGFAIGEDGSLTLITATGGLPTNAIGPLPLNMGLAARDNG
jgi:6-phosphogluconolactonase (cycloisomerase 2 family)